MKKNHLHTKTKKHNKTKLHNKTKKHTKTKLNNLKLNGGSINICTLIKKLQNNELYYRDYNINLYKISDNEKDGRNDFHNIVPFATLHNDGRFRSCALNTTKAEYIIKLLRQVDSIDGPNPPTNNIIIFKLFKKIQQNYKLLICINEIMASLIYNRVFKLYSPEIILVYDINKNEYIIGSRKDKTINKKKNITDLPIHDDIIYGFLVDCIMANWDIVASDNSFITKKNNNNKSLLNDRITRLDVGGSMFFRAMGDFKLSFINNEPPIEHDTLISKNTTVYSKILNLLPISTKYIKEIYELEKFNKIDEVRYDLLSKMRELFDKDIDNMANIYILVNTNIIQLKRRWVWYLVNKNFGNDNHYTIPIPNNIIRDEKVNHWDPKKTYPNSSQDVPKKDINSIRIMTFNMGHIINSIKPLLDTGVDIECYQETPNSQETDYKLWCNPNRQPPYGTNTINYNETNLQQLCTIHVQKGFALENPNSPPPNNKFARSGKCVNVLGIELKKSKKKTNYI